MEESRARGDSCDNQQYENDQRRNGDVVSVGFHR
jgi:hypothetical protein